jgi:hypothetical protein
LFIPGLIHDFGYRFDYIWIRGENGRCYKDNIYAGRKHWDKLFYEAGEHVNGMKTINFLAWIALYFFGFFAWYAHRRKYEKDILPCPGAEAVVVYTFESSMENLALCPGFRGAAI